MNKHIKWVEKACNKKDGTRSHLKELAYIDGRVMGTDGKRLHAWRGESDIVSPTGYPDVIGVIERAKAGQTTVTISKYHLIQTCNAVRALDKRNATVKMSVADVLYCESSCNGDKVSVYIKDGDNWPGKSTKVKYPQGKPHVVQYAKQGPGVYIALHPKYIIDALQGMDDVVTITFKGKHDPIYTQADDKEAVIMPMNMGR